jgi:ketopantoate reductase
MIAPMLGTIPWLSGAVVRLGNELGVPTPANSFAYATLKLNAEGWDPAKT